MKQIHTPDFLITPEEMKELIWSLSWYPFSAYHNTNVASLLSKIFPKTNFKKDLEEFEKVYKSKPGPGSPK